MAWQAQGQAPTRSRPAVAAGGIPMVKSLHAPYQHRGVKFIATGEIRNH
jgi:2-keto-3-deoxy-6-phosphogluconate aldolase